MKYNTMTHAAMLCTDGTNGYADGFLYHICEFKSGRAFGSGLNKSHALSKAVKNINKAGIEKVKAMIKTSIEKYGIANKEQ